MRQETEQSNPWSPSNRAPVLEPGCAHVWLADLNLPRPAFEVCGSFLSEEETARANRFRFEKDRNHFIVGRGILRRLLGDYLQQDPARLTFTYNRYGKPLLDNPVPRLHFNLSHSYGYALLGFAQDVEMGVDIEKIRPDFATREIAERFFAPDEVAVLASLKTEQQPDAFFKCWTRKEAFIKAHGMGLSFGLDKFSVSFAPDAPPALLRSDPEPDAARQWSLFDLPVPATYLGALAIKRVPCEVRLFRPAWTAVSS